MYCVCLSTFLLVLKEQNNAFVVYKLLQSITKVFIHDIWLQITNVCKNFCENETEVADVDSPMDVINSWLALLAYSKFMTS